MADTHTVTLTPEQWVGLIQALIQLGAPLALAIIQAIANAQKQS